MDRGTVVWVDLDPTLGHEQGGVRPCVIVSDAAVNHAQRFPIVAVVPVTSTPGLGALYPRLAPGPPGLMRLSCALVDQVRSVDKRRLRRSYGRLPAGELRAIDAALALFLGLRPSS